MWTTYAIVVAAFCYTHYFAVFTVTGEVIFAVGYLLATRRTCVYSQAGPGLCGLLYALTLAGVLYFPWVPIIFKQSQAVQEHFWIQAPTLEKCESVLFEWATGLHYQGMAGVRCCEGFLAILIVVALWRGGAAGRLLVLLAALPWILSLGLSGLLHRPLFLDRYLAFGHPFLLILIGIAWAQQRTHFARALFGCFMGIPCVYATGISLLERPTRPPAIVAAAEYLRRSWHSGDIVQVSSPQDVNMLRYYGSQGSLLSLDVRCFLDPFRQDTHATHAASLSADDILWREDLERATLRHVWVASDKEGIMTEPPDPGMKLISCHTFHGGGDTRYLLVLYGRDP